MKVLSQGKERGFLYGPALWLQRMEEKCARALGRRSRGLEVLIGIYGPSGGRTAYREYRIREKEKLLLFFLAGISLTLGLVISGRLQRAPEGVRTLQRPASGAGNAVYEMDVTADGEKLAPIRIEVPEQEPSQEEIRRLLEDAALELEDWMEKNGWDPDGLKEDPKLPETLQRGMVDVVWESSRYDVLDSAGHLHNELLPEEGETVTLRAILSCRETEKILTYPVRVLPKGQDTASRLFREVSREIQKEDPAEAEVVYLPEEFEGKALSWQTARPAYGLLAALLTAAGCIALRAASERDLCQKGEKRHAALLAEYPSFLLRLTLLAGTGMPLRAVFLRLGREGEKEDPLPVYEEVLRTVREMESGKTELQAYESFGSRCQLSQYRKCASLLAQNLKKGTGGLVAALGQEAAVAFEERKALARRKGEEAQTKLLLPMLMTLAVVMVLIMVPACFSFGGF